MNIIQFILSVYGLGWIILFLAISVMGGHVVVEIKNPLTKKSEPIVDVRFGKNTQQP